MNNTPPLCLAPWNGILIDTDKQVRPCCATSTFFGNLNQNSLDEIISGPVWTDVKTKLANQEWPVACQGCKASEERTGWSVRTSFLTYKKFEGCIDNEIVYLELDGSNICNLACLHCSPKFSSKWLSEWSSLEKDIDFLYPANIPKPEYFSVDPALILTNLEKLDLSKLKYMVFKGGDPLLNEETLIALKHFDKISVLSNLEIDLFTNGTVINKEILHLLNKAETVYFNVSVDGVGKLNEYIRYGNGSNTENIKKNIEVFKSSVKGFRVQPSVSTMIYNIFNLLEIRDFWMELNSKYERDNNQIAFRILVNNPIYLNIQILPKDVRKELIEYYKKNQLLDEFEIVLKTLAGEYLGDKVHNEWVTYTKKMEKLRGNSIVELVPRLKEFLYYK